MSYTVDIKPGEHYEVHRLQNGRFMCVLKLEIAGWIGENDFGPFSVDGSPTKATLYFDNDDDAMAFKLRWI